MLRVELHRAPGSKMTEAARYEGVAKFPTPPGRS
jgi:hypothetical protein